jgi:hypothetical protein
MRARFDSDLDTIAPLASLGSSADVLAPEKLVASSEFNPTVYEHIPLRLRGSAPSPPRPVLVHLIQASPWS